MTLRTARGLVALAIVFASIGAGFWLHAIWTSRRGPEVSVAHSANTADALQAAFVTVAERGRPAVVHIRPGPLRHRDQPSLERIGGGRGGGSAEHPSALP